MIGPLRLLLAGLALLLGAAPALAQDFPARTGRIVDQADLLSPAQEAELAQRLAALEKATSRQLVVATVPSLQDYPIEDYGYRLGRHWGIGQEGADNGAILLVAPNERKVRIEAGYGLGPILTDALSSLIIQREILPRFRDGDMAGGIIAGADAIIDQLQAPPELAEQRVLEAREAASRRGTGSVFPLLFWIVVLFFILVPLLRSGFRGRRYGGRRRRGMPVIIWGPGTGTGGWGGSSSSSSLPTRATCRARPPACGTRRRRA
jgi:uncharacterized protein